MTSYLKLLEEQEGKTANPLLIRQIQLYRQFIHDMVKINVVLNKSFYVIISYSPLEGGATNVVSSGKNVSSRDAHILSAQKSLRSKIDAMHRCV